VGAFERMTMRDGAEINVYRAVPKANRRGGLVPTWCASEPWRFSVHMVADSV
jgi:hypothetical protein